MLRRAFIGLWMCSLGCDPEPRSIQAEQRIPEGVRVRIEGVSEGAECFCRVRPDTGPCWQGAEGVEGAERTEGAEGAE